MKIYTVNYKINSINNYKYIVLADFHGYFNLKLAEYISSIPKDYIIITGDIIDGYQWTNKKIVNKIKDFINIIKTNTKVIIGLGNHDLWGLTKKGLTNFKNLKCENVYPIYNETIIIDDNTFTNFIPDKSCYNYFKQDSKKTINKIIRQFNKSLDLPKGNYINHLVSHNPYHFCHNEVIKYISKHFDIIETGHFHDGWIPTNYLNNNYSKLLDKGLQELIYILFKRDNNRLYVKPKRNLSRGIVYMYTEGYYLLLPNNNIYYYNKKENKYHPSNINDLNNRLSIEKVPALVISGAINTFMRLNIFYPHITCIETTKEESIYDANYIINKI